MVIFSRKNGKFSSDVRTDFRHLSITLSRNVKIYPITEKEIRVNQASKISYPPRKRDLQALAVITFERLPHSKHAFLVMCGWIEKKWNLLVILVPNW